MTLHCSCGKQAGPSGAELVSITIGDRTHNFDGSPCFPRCPQLGAFVMAKPGEAPSRFVSIDPAKTVSCHLEAGHDGDHDYEDIWHTSWEAATG